MMLPMATVLDREMYSDVEAARLLGVPVATFRRWLDGSVRSGVAYDPILRPTSTGSRTVTWGEYVEADYLRQYRKIHDVSLQSLRRFVKRLRDDFDVPYPLAHHRPWVGPGKRLLIAAQEEANLEPDLWSAYEPRSGVVLLTSPSESFLSRVTFDSGVDDVALTIHPDGKQSPVVINPTVRFGSPTVCGISTESIVDAVNGGDSVEAVARDYGLTIADVASAITYESRRSNAIAA
jgi:uncharacterized protein (DUF433 family)